MIDYKTGFFSTGRTFQISYKTLLLAICDKRFRHTFALSEALVGSPEVAARIVVAFSGCGSWLSFM